MFINFRITGKVKRLVCTVCAPGRARMASWSEKVTITTNNSRKGHIIKSSQFVNDFTAVFYLQVAYSYAHLHTSYNQIIISPDIAK